MKSDQICWIDSRTIKRGHVLMLDGSLVPFCSKCLDACMRANNALSGFEKEQVRELTAQARTVRSMRADGPLPSQKVWWKSHVAGGRSGPLGRTVRHSNSPHSRKGVLWSGLWSGPRTVRRWGADSPQAFC
jgi:hypothetical protein